MTDKHEYFANSELPPEDLEAIEALLDGIVIEEGDVVEETHETATEVVAERIVTETIAIKDVVIETVAPDTLEMDAAAEEHLETELMKAEVYEGVEAGTDTTLEDKGVEASTEQPAAKEPKAPKAKKAKSETPARVKDISTLPAENFVLSSDVPDDLEANKKTVLGARPAQKKIAEKFDNAIAAAAAGKAPSVFITFAHGVLSAKGGSATSSEIVAAMTSVEDGWSEGTARSQTGQIMALFPALGIAKRDGNALTLIASSTLGAMYADLAKAA